ncbi:MAG: hypothetical protein R3208_05885 [Ketobacteraceae bacterium]|nr:hypothetical protein [Ketobacteraceae bacterium]
MSSESLNPEVARKNRSMLLITVAAFILPALLAYLAHITGFWQSQGTTNHGTLVLPPIEFDELSLTTSGGEDTVPFDRGEQWWIAYAVPANCDAACRNSLLQMRQTQTATGPYQKRVSTLLIQHEHSDPSAVRWAAENAPDMTIVSVKKSQWSEHLIPAAIGEAADMSEAGQVYLIDPMGALFMTYPGQPDEQAAIKQGKGMLKDLQRVLKLSKIG